MDFDHRIDTIIQSYLKMSAIKRTLDKICVQSYHAPHSTAFQAKIGDQIFYIITATKKLGKKPGSTCTHRCKLLQVQMVHGKRVKCVVYKFVAIPKYFGKSKYHMNSNLSPHISFFLELNWVCIFHQGLYYLISSLVFIYIDNESYDSQMSGFSVDKEQ